MYRAISDYGTRVFSAVDEHDVPVLWRLILEDVYESAAELLKFAKENHLLVTFRGEGGDLLWWTIDNKSVECVKFILDKLLERFTSLEETCYLLNLHFCKLVDEFPDLIWDYLQKDKFTFEYARFKIPKYLYALKARSVAGLLTNYRLKDWESIDSDGTDEFWFPYIQDWMRAFDKEARGYVCCFKGYRKTTDAKMTVVAKFFCISCFGRQTETG